MRILSGTWRRHGVKQRFANCYQDATLRRATARLDSEYMLIKIAFEQS